MCTYLSDAAFMHNDDLVTALNRRQAVRDDDRCAAFHKAIDCFSNFYLSLRIDARRGLVEDEDFGIVRERPGKSKKLPLADAQGCPALVDWMVQSRRQRAQKGRKTNVFHCSLDAFSCNGRAKPDIRLDGARK